MSGLLPTGYQTVEGALWWYYDAYGRAVKAYERKRNWSRWERCLRKKIRAGNHLLLHRNSGVKRERP